ncbi:MAG TPA: DnaJ family domain-containing protein [Casimicrobiaceae bacterium]|jgi:hypothetical protein
MRTLDEEIARRLQEAADSGELGLAKGYGEPFPPDPGWDATPDALRMPMKILKDSGVIPPEIAWFHERGRLKASIETAAEPGERHRLRRELSELEQKIALRLESLRLNSNL